MTGVRVTMTRDLPGRADGDRAPGYAEGMWKDYASGEDAQAEAKWLADQGWTVTIRTMGESVEAPPGTLLSGIVGSVAYGLETDQSDIDRLGVFAAPTETLVSLHPPKPSIVHTGPDATFHEAGKFATLALKANPTITELMWLPDDLYETRSPLGEDLIVIRRCFLSRTAVRNAYLGYATQQFRRLENRGDGSFSADTRKRTAKHGRHLLRLIAQGAALYVAGEFTVRLEDPERYRAFGEQVAAGDLGIARDALSRAEIQFDVPSPLPERPDEATVADWLAKVRREHFEQEAA